MTAQRPTPTAIAAGRFRPALLGVRDAAPSAVAPMLSTATRSDLEQLGFLVLQDLVDLVHVLLGHAVEALLGRAHLVFTELAVLERALEVLLGVATYVANGDLGVLGLAARQLDVLAAPLLGELGHHDAKGVTVVGRVDAE